MDWSQRAGELVVRGRRWGPLLSLGAVAAILPPPVLAEQGDEALLPEITVMGQLFGSRTEDQLVRPATIVEGEELERRRHAGTIGEVLDGLPGVSNADFGPAVGRPTIRGLQGARVEELQDGMRISDVSDEGVDHAVGGDARRAQAVELIRGPASLIYGSGAAGGVVNIVTGRFDPAIGDTVSGRLYGAYTDNANERQGYAGVAVPLHESFELRADYSLREADDADIDGFQGRERVEGAHLVEDTLVNSDVSDESWSLTGMWSERWGYVGVGYDRWEMDYGVPEAFFPVHPDGDFGLSDEYERIYAEYDRLDLRSELYDPFPGFTAMRFNASYTEFEQDEVEYDYDTDTGRLDEIKVEDVFEQDELDARLELSHEPIEALGGLEGVFGLDFHSVDYEGRAEDGGDDLIRPTERTSTAVFLLEELPTGFGGEFGARVELGAEHQVRSSVTYAERAPSAEQLYAFARHGAAGTWEVGDPDLDEERYVNLDVALERPRGETRYEVGVFYNRVDDFIYLQSFDDNGEPLLVATENSDVVQDAGGDQLVYNTAADVHLYGAELEGAHDFEVANLPVTARVTGDYLRGRFRDGGSLPRMTAPRLGVGLDTAWRTLDFGVDWRHVFSQEDTAAGETETDSYNLIGFDVGWEPREVQDLRLFVRGRNLLDEDGRRHESFFKDSAPIRGRSYTAGVSYDF